MNAVPLTFAVTMINEEKCDATQPMTMNYRSEGYLASVVTEESGCGSSSTPWVIHAFPGIKGKSNYMAQYGLYASLGVSKVQGFVTL